VLGYLERIPVCTAYVRCFDDLPELARAYVLRLEQLLEVPIRWVSFGPRREQLIERA